MDSGLCAIVCDGAGSAEYGGEGASIICRSFSRFIQDHFSKTQSLPSEEEIWSCIDDIRDRLSVAADKREVRRQNFASTLVALVVTEAEIAVIHVGDGAIVGRKKNDKEWQALTWPENGEYASTTYFLTDDPRPKVRITYQSNEFDAFAVFSDGIEALALDYAANTAFAPFFNKMIVPLDALNVAGSDGNLSEALGGFLDSERVCSRTDDDKSLILISSI